MNLLVNIDVENLEKATRFYCDALGLRVGRRFEGAVELLGLNAPIYLLDKPRGTRPFAGGAARSYDRHWTSVHLDFEVTDLPRAVARAIAAGAGLEQDASSPAAATTRSRSQPGNKGSGLTRSSFGG